MSLDRTANVCLINRSVCGHSEQCRGTVVGCAPWLQLRAAIVSYCTMVATSRTGERWSASSKYVAPWIILPRRNNVSVKKCRRRDSTRVKIARKLTVGWGDRSLITKTTWYISGYCCIYMGIKHNDVISSYHIYLPVCHLFSRLGQAVRSVCYCDS